MRRKNQQVSDMGRIREILEANRIVRFALYDPASGYPYIVPMNYGYETGADGRIFLYAHSARQGRKLDLLRRDPRAAFEIDATWGLTKAEKPCDWGTNYDSITGVGTVEIVEQDAGEKKRMMDLLMRHHGGDCFDYRKSEFAAMAMLKFTSSYYTAKAYRAECFSPEGYQAGPG